MSKPSRNTTCSVTFEEAALNRDADIAVFERLEAEEEKLRNRTIGKFESEIELGLRK